MTTESAESSAAFPVRYPSATRAVGITPAERYLQRLCERTFLRLWSYPGLHRNQAGGKEVADLVVVYGDDIIIFSDKSCAFPNTGDLQVDWSRWYRKAVRKSAEQAWAGERWLLRHTDRVFLDVACTQPFPLALPPAERARVHRIVVAHSVADRCRQQFGGSGSLMFDAALGNSDQLPFTVGDLDAKRGFVHVLDDTTLEIVLGCLDTVADFVAYLRAKEAFIRSGRLSLAAGEEELLALYLTHGTTTEHQFPPAGDGEKLLVLEGHWSAFDASPERRAQREANEISYAWDALIGTFETHFLAGTSEFRSHPELRDSEPSLRLLAGESRTRRRYLASQLIELVQTPIPTGRPWNVRVIASERPGHPAYVLLTLSRRYAESQEHYRQQRRQVMEWHLMVTRHLHPSFDPIVGVATDSVDAGELRSEDLYLLREDDWTPALAEEARRLHEEWGLLKQVGEFEMKVIEYPVPVGHGSSPRLRTAASPPLSGRDRNTPCPCGSAKKWKRCCGG